MKKTIIILSAIGGVSVLAAIVLVLFVLNAMSSNAEASDDIETAVENVAKCLGGKVFPDKEGEQSVKTNAALYAAWSDAAFAQVSQYDRRIAPLTPPAFKEAMQEEAERIGSRPGTAEGRFAPPKFGFGPFEKYVVGTAMPPSAPQALAGLQRQWSEVAFALNVLVGCGAEELKSVDAPGAVESAKSAQVEQALSGRNEKKPKKGKAKKGASGAAAAGAAKHPAPTVTRFTLKFLAHPAAFVRALDAFATTNRFIVVEDFSFSRGNEELDKALRDAGKGEQEEEVKSSGRRSRSRDRTRSRDRSRDRSRSRDRNAKQGDADEPTKRQGAVTDPETAEPLLVTLGLAVYDFGCPPEEKTAEPDEKTDGKAAESNEATVDAASTNKVEEVAK